MTFSVQSISLHSRRLVWAGLVDSVALSLLPILCLSDSSFSVSLSAVTREIPQIAILLSAVILQWYLGRKMQKKNRRSKGVKPCPTATPHFKKEPRFKSPVVVYSLACSPAWVASAREQNWVISYMLNCWCMLVLLTPRAMKDTQVVLMTSRCCVSRSKVPSRQGVGVAVKIYNIDQNPLAGNEFRDTRMQCAWCQAIAFELTSCCVQVLVILLWVQQRIGKNPQALDDLIRETASKMAYCPFFVLEPTSIRRRPFGKVQQEWERGWNND